MVGYSKLTGDNQTLALELLEEHDSICEPIIANYSGKIIKHIGDAIFAVFPAPEECVNCAIEIQTELSKRNSLNPDDRRILIRIGLHYGETYQDGKELLGEGVNIAGQVEPMAPFGGIAVSESIYNYIRDKKDIYSRAIGFVQFKNVDKPIRIHKIYLNLMEWIEETIEVLKETMKGRNIPFVNVKKKRKEKQVSNTAMIKYKDSFLKLIEEGEAKLKVGEFTNAEKTFTELLDLSRKHNDGEGMGVSLIKIGEAFHKLGDLSAALRNTISGVRTFAFEGHSDIEMNHRILLADRFAELGLEDKTERELKKVEKYYQNNVSEELEFNIHSVKGNIFLSRGKFDQALEKIEKLCSIKTIIQDSEIYLSLCEIYLIKDDLDKAKKILDNFNYRNGEIITETQLWSESLRSIISSKTKEPDLDILDKLESNCVNYIGFKPIYRIWWNLSQAHLWRGDLDKAEECQQHAQDNLNAWINKISDVHILDLFRNNVHFHREIFSFLELPEGVESIDSTESDENEWCFDCGKIIKEIFNYCPHCGVTLIETSV